MNRFLLLFCFLIATSSWAQEAVVDSVKTEVDNRYREDQFYFGITYNLLTSVPSGVRLRGFSGGVRFGFLRNMPFNQKRTLAFAVGGGLGFNRYGNTMAIKEGPNGLTEFTIIDSETPVESNRFSTAKVEVPLQFRWRNSSATEYRFYRIHAGVNLAYVFSNQATFVQEGNRIKTRNINEFNKFQAQLTLLFGYNTINFYAAYQLTPFFNDQALIDTTQVQFRPLHLGIQFYFL